MPSHRPQSVAGRGSAEPVSSVLLRFKMGACFKLAALVTVLLAVGFGVLWQKFIAPGPLPVLQDVWWGPGQPREVGLDIVPFKIEIHEKVIQDLHARLDQWKNPTKPLENANFTYGFNTDYLQKIVQFWRKDYDWKKREAFLNSLPQFKTNIAGLNIHFVHVKPKNVPAGTRVLPLLVPHGWPETVRQLYSLIPLLTTPRKGQDFVFEVIAPSLPGFGFSDGAVRRGLGAAQMAVILRQLMFRLGFQRFYAQGGNWGSYIITIMSTLYPENVIAMHSNGCFVIHPLANVILFAGQLYPSLIEDPKYQDRIYPLSQSFSLLLEELGYMHIQSTKPDTIGVALRDSPVGLAAYILEKYSTWTNKKFRNFPDGGLTQKFTLTDLLDSVMVFWVTDSINTAIRLYAESFSTAHFNLGIDKIPSTVPTACASPPDDPFLQPEIVLKLKYRNLVQFTRLPKGGLFAPFEEPKIVADDIWDAFSNIFKQKL